MGIQTERLQGVLRAIVRQVSQSLPHDAVQALLDEVESIEQPVEKPADPYEGKSAAELLQMAQGGDQEALSRYVASLNPSAATAPAATQEAAE